MLDPKWSYPDDPYRNESYWPEGYAQLSKVKVTFKIDNS